MFKKYVAKIDSIKTDLFSAIESIKVDLNSAIEKLLTTNNKRLEDLDLKYERFEIEIHKKLNNSHTEYSNKLFEILSSFLRWNKEISLVSFLGGKEPNLDKLKRELLRPMNESNWAKTNADEAERINKALESNGEKVRKKRQDIKEKLLAEERQGKDTTITKQHLDFLNSIIGD